MQKQQQQTYKSLMKNIKEKQNTWRHISCSWIERVKVVKMLIIYSLIYRLSVIQLKFPQASL